MVIKQKKQAFSRGTCFFTNQTKMDTKTIALVVCSLLPVFLDDKGMKKHQSILLLFAGLILVIVAFNGFGNSE